MRAQGRGTQRKDGRWASSVTLPDGRKQYVYAPSQRALLAELAKVRRAIERGEATTQSRQPLSSYLEEWLAAVKDQVRPSSYRKYRGIVQRHLVPALGSTQLGKLRPVEIQRLYTALSDKGLAPRTVKSVHIVLHMALQQAQEWQLLVSNPTERVKPPRAPHQEAQTLTLDQVRQVLDAVRDHAYEGVIVLALTTAMRQGEILGLRWQDVDLPTGLLTVRVALSADADNQPLLAETKTPSSRRPIQLPGRAVAALQRQRERQTAARLLAPAWNEQGLIFTEGPGNPLRPNHLRRVVWYPLLERLGLPRMKFHGARHTVLTLAAQQGVHPRALADLAGHSSTSVTMQTYSHVTAELRDQTLQALDRLFPG